MDCGRIFHIRIIENVSPVDMTVILSEFIPLFIGIEFFEQRILLKIRIPCDQHVIGIEIIVIHAAVYEIRCITWCDDNINGFIISYTIKIWLFYLNTGLLCNNVRNLIVIADLIARICNIHRHVIDSVIRWRRDRYTGIRRRAAHLLTEFGLIRIGISDPLNLRRRWSWSTWCQWNKDRKRQ